MNQFKESVTIRFATHADEGDEETKCDSLAGVIDANFSPNGDNVTIWCIRNHRGVETVTLSMTLSQSLSLANAIIELGKIAEANGE